jgi:hypothetical protein
VLCCVVLCSAVLYCVVLCFALLCCVVLCCAVLCCALLYNYSCSSLFCFSAKVEGKGMDDSKVVAEADALYKSGEGEKLYALLVAHKDSHNANILWRLARATCDLAKESKDQKRRAELMNEAFDYVSRALTADPNNYACHKVRCEGGGWLWVSVTGNGDGSTSYIEHIHLRMIG